MYSFSSVCQHREDFEARKQELEESKSRPIQKPTQVLCSVGFDYSNKPFLQALAEREELVRSGKLSTIIFIRDFNAKGQEVSGYIDYGHRLQSEDCRIYFSGKKRMLPKPSDLSYYNWETHTNTSSPTATFQLRADEAHGLVFKCSKDRKLVSVDPSRGDSGKTGDSSERVSVTTDEYVQVALYDHVTRRKA
jgi:hypothetical protein